MTNATLKIGDYVSDSENLWLGEGKGFGDYSKPYFTRLCGNSLLLLHEEYEGEFGSAKFFELDYEGEEDIDTTRTNLYISKDGVIFRGHVHFFKTELKNTPNTPQYLAKVVGFAPDAAKVNAKLEAWMNEKMGEYSKTSTRKYSVLGFKYLAIKDGKLGLCGVIHSGITGCDVDSSYYE